LRRTKTRADESDKSTQLGKFAQTLHPSLFGRSQTVA